MKKLFALTAILLASAFANAALADTVTTNFNTGNGDVQWFYSDLKGTPTAAYGNGNGASFLNNSPNKYKEAYVINNPHSAWVTWEGGHQWIGPSSDAGKDSSTSAGYTAYNANGFQTNQKNVMVNATADNGIANIFIGSGDTYIDLMSSVYSDFVGIAYNTTINGVKIYDGPEYTTTPYGGQGLFVGTMEMMINWTGLMSSLNWDAEAEYDWYFITQNTNSYNSASATGFAATFDGTMTNGEIATQSDTNATPEPATLAIFGLGILGAGFAARRRNAK